MKTKPDRKTLIEIYRLVARIKLNDERLRATLRAGKFAATYYSPRGQEVIPAAISVNLRSDDYIVTIYRGIHDQISKGIPLRELWAEYAGKATGACKGKGGPMHITHPKTGIMVTTGVVGSGIPIANGLALASQVKNDGRVTVCYFGDGASNIGAFHESLNLASIWKLPVLFVCQNNGYAEHSRFEFGTAVANVADRAAGYRMPGITVDGNNPDEMWRVASEAVERARDGHGPTLIEARTFRFLGHVLGDQSDYIPAEEMKAALERDPVPALRARLIGEGHMSESELADMESAISREIDDAVEFALSSAYPDVSEIRRDVYAAEVAA
jgi:acetoin:2,6-dichlorophenolindophenol oxidoreductase subunit alpha